LKRNWNMTPRRRSREGPCWDVRRQLLYWVDIEGHRLHIYDPAKHDDRAIGVSSSSSRKVRREVKEAHTCDLTTQAVG